MGVLALYKHCIPEYTIPTYVDYLPMYFLPFGAQGPVAWPFTMAHLKSNVDF